MLYPPVVHNSMTHRKIFHAFWMPFLLVKMRAKLHRTLRVQVRVTIRDPLLVKVPAKALAQVEGRLLVGVPGGVRVGGAGPGARKSARETPGRVCGQDWLQMCPQMCL